MTLVLPRIGNSPYDTPEVFQDAWDVTMTAIENAINGATSGGGANDAWFYKTGRMIGSPLPTLAASPALGIWLPDGFMWMQDGVAITLEDGVLVGDLPQNFDGYASIKATDDGSGGYDWEVLATNALKSTFTPGIGVIGHVVTDSSGLTSIGTGAADADIVYDMPTILALLAATSGGTGAAVTLLSQLGYSEEDTRNAITVINELMAANLAAATANSGTRPAITDTDQLTTELAITRQGVIALQPDEGERSRSANVEAAVDGTFGDGTNSHPDFVDYTTATQNEDGEFEV